jgi:hypothetical protein
VSSDGGASFPAPVGIVTLSWPLVAAEVTGEGIDLVMRRTPFRWLFVGVMSECTEYINVGYTDLYWHGPDGEATAATHAALIGTTPHEWGPDSATGKNAVRVEHPPTRLKF